VADINSVYGNYRGAAKRRGYSFELDLDTFSNLIKSPCHYCGETGSMTVKTKRHIIVESPLRYNGVDRVNNSKGYTPDNCVSCCDICNNSKSTLSISEWKEWIDRIYSKMHH